MERLQSDNPYKLDAKQFGNAMGTIAHSQAVMAAVRDYKKVWYATAWNLRHMYHTQDSHVTMHRALCCCAGDGDDPEDGLAARAAAAVQYERADER